MDKSKASGKVTMSGKGDAGDVDHLNKGEADKQLFHFRKQHWTCKHKDFCLRRWSVEFRSWYSISHLSIFGTVECSKF